jgi:hypothetical protein
MAELTPEEKRRIYEEEKTRLEARESLKKVADQKKSKNAGIGCLVIIVIIGVIWIISNLSSDKSGSSSAPSDQEVKLTADVTFTGTQFILTNNDSFNWTKVNIEINGGLLSGGYELNTDLITAKETYSVGAMQFAKSDGTRLNPFATKPQKVFITARTPRGTGYYSGSWK